MMILHTMVQKFFNFSATSWFNPATLLPTSIIKMDWLSGRGVYLRMPLSHYSRKLAFLRLGGTELCTLLLC
jgi:hypothetical protein